MNSPFQMKSAKRRIRIWGLFLVLHGNVVDLTFDGPKPSIPLSQFTAKKLASFVKKTLYNWVEVDLELPIRSPGISVCNIRCVLNGRLLGFTKFSHPVNCGTTFLLFSYSSLQAQIYPQYLSLNTGLYMAVHLASSNVSSETRDSRNDPQSNGTFAILSTCHHGLQHSRCLLKISNPASLFSGREIPKAMQIHEFNFPEE